MKFFKLVTSGVVVLTTCAESAFAGRTYSVSERIQGEDFYNAFTFEAIPDPTNGRVNYVDEATARNLNLTYATADSFILRADNTTVLTPSSPGRNSVRLRSVQKYRSHVVVFDTIHMPEGCGTWPAIWETDESTWPNGGEIDIVEGVNDQGPNQSTLHTSSNCSILASNARHLGKTTSTNCDVAVNGNQGCAIKAPVNSSSFGPSFNAAGGGWYAMERSDNHFSIWFWQRDNVDAPMDAIRGDSVIDTRTWGAPIAYFSNRKCNFSEHFGAHNIIINLTLCGAWAGLQSVYAASTCPSTCIDYVDNNPSGFTEAYFQFTVINIYE